MYALLVSSHNDDAYERFPDMAEAGYVIEQISADKLIARLKVNLDINAIVDIILIEYNEASFGSSSELQASRSENIARVVV